MSDDEADTVWIHCSLLNDDISDLETTPRPAPVSRIQPRSIDVDSLFDQGDALTQTNVLSCANESDTDVFPDTSDSSQATSEPRIPPPTPASATTTTTPLVTAPPVSPPPIQTAPRTTALLPVFVPRTAAPSTACDTAPWLVATQLVDDPAPRATAPVIRPVTAPSKGVATPPPRPASAPLTATSPLYDIDFLAELDFRLRQEEQAAARLAEEQAAMQLVEEYEHSSQERLRSMVRIYEEVSYDETAVSRASTAEDDNSDISIYDSPPQTPYCVARAQYLVKRRSKRKARHEYPVKRGGNPSDALVVVRYPDINAKFTVRRFGLQEMDARHGKLSKFRRAWLVDYQADQRGYRGEGKLVFGIRLYCADCIYRAQLVLPDMYEEMYYVDLFFRNKFYSAFGKQQPAVAPPRHYQAWCNFVNAYIDANSREANAYENSLRGREERFYSKSVLGVAMNIHALSMKKQIPCTVPVDVECPSCYPGSSRETIGSTSPSDLVALHSHLYELLSKQKRNTTPAVSESSEWVIVRGRCSQQSLKHGTHACARGSDLPTWREEEDLRAWRKICN
ncbi:hypothetical protein FI667_g7376, partial [Globisporangium splendens]